MTRMRYLRVDVTIASEIVVVGVDEEGVEELVGSRITIVDVEGAG